MKRKLLVFALLLITPFIFAGDFSVVVNKANDVSSISKGDLKKIYLGKKTTWPNGNTIKVAALKKGPAHTAFLKAVVKKAPSAFSLLWKKAVFTGTGNPPKFFDNEADLLKYIEDTPGAIGYASVTSSSVKEITVN
jgi:ABC-type phosphate transport system substrate-binding protein